MSNDNEILSNGKDLNLTGLNGKQIWETLYNKELNCKKNILEYIELIKVLKHGNAAAEQIEDTYKFIYDSIEAMDNIKVNTMMYLKNQLKAQLGKFVKEKEPKEINHFIEFFKKAYPLKERRKDFTWVLMDINKIADEQIWHTLTYINRWCLKNDSGLSMEEKQDIIEVLKLLLKRNNLNYINNVKSLSTMLDYLGIELIKSNSGFKIKNKQ